MNKGILSIVSALAGAAAGACAAAGAMESRGKKDIAKAWEYSDKHLALLQMMNQWVRVKQEGKNLAAYFEERGYQKIAIYGMSYAGETLLNELKGTTVQTAYGIDRNAEGIFADVDILTINDALPDVDAVVVTAITYFDEIAEKLRGKIDCPVLSLEDILYEV